MELFLNLVWAVVSIGLACFWVQALRRGDSRAEWRVLIAFAVLIVLLFPVISMTDDLAAFNNPAETEHAFRRSAAPFLHASSFPLVGFVFALLLLAFTAFTSLLASTLIDAASPAARLLAGLLKAHGVRPPPSFHLA